MGLDPSGKRLFDKALPNDEARLRAVFDQLAARGRVLIVVDQPNTIADAARTMPHTLRQVDTGDETLTELGVSGKRPAPVTASEAC